MLVTIEVISTTDQWLKEIQGFKGGWVEKLLHSPWMTLVAILNPGLQRGMMKVHVRHELESSVNLAPDKRMPGVQAESRLAGDVPPAVTKCRPQNCRDRSQRLHHMAGPTWQHGNHGPSSTLFPTDFGQGLLT